MFSNTKEHHILNIWR